MTKSETQPHARTWSAVELRNLSAEARDAILEEAASIAEEEYRVNLELTAFEAFGEADFDGEGAEGWLLLSRRASSLPKALSKEKPMDTIVPRYSKEEFAHRGDAIYRKEVLPKLAAKDVGKFLAIDIDTGEYEIAADELKAGDKLLARLPQAQIWMVRIGYAATHSFGGRQVRQELP